MAAHAQPGGPRAAPAAGDPGGGVVWSARAGIVPPLAGAFTVRADSVPGIEAMLVPGAAVALVPGEESGGHLDGWAGSCGKTQLASYLAGVLWQSGRIDFLAWVNAASRASVLSGYAEAAARLGLDDGGDAEPVAARFAGWLAGTARRWLLVLDDLRDAADLDGLWPGGPAGRVVITAADAAVIPGEQGAVTVPVPAFSMREAMAHLFGRLSADQDQRSGAYDLAGHLGGEPAALAQAGAVMADSGTGCRDYQHRFTQLRARLRAAGAGEPPAAAVTWLLSADYAENLLPGSGTWPLLLLTALLDSHGIPAAVLTAPATCKYLADTGAGYPPGPQQAWKAVLALERAGLISVGPAGEPAVWTGTPLQASARAAASPELLSLAVQAAADALLEAWPKDQPRSGRAAQMRACAASLLRCAGDDLWADGSCHRVLLAAGQSLAAARLAGPAAGWWREVEARCERLLGPGHPDTLIVAGQLADALLAAGQYADAVQCARRVLDGRDRVLGPGHPAAIAARVSLGRALAACGETREALTVLRDAAGRSQRAHGPGDPGALADLDEYAAAFLAAGDPAAAVRFCEQALTGRERLLGPADPATLSAALRLAGAFLAGGKVKAAIGQYKRVLAARERVLGPDHPDTLAVRVSLAASYDTAGQIGDALREHQQACAGYERVLGPDHPDTLACRADLADAYHAAGQLGDAITLLNDSIPRAEQALSPGDPVTRRLRQVLDGITADTSAG
ncbi:MAG TPA: tetratricopeptide repeat protein [Streptosporangiaceae bacterium]|nr:tetratricopeptide repeat protein [Streptosporangiaceae bacterium]